MNESQAWLEKIEKVVEENKPYTLDAFKFVLDALHETVSALDQPRHVSGRELLDGIRTYALKCYGPLAKTVLNYWGIRETEDFGRIVFLLVDIGLLRKQPEDKIEDFRGVYDFQEAFSTAINPDEI